MVQRECQQQDPANDPEIIDADLVDLELRLRESAVPAPGNADSPEFRRGEHLFSKAGGDVRHVPRLKTAETYPAFPPLANRTFNAYTDLLVHDMGEDLADHRSDYTAGGRDWRTTPLWGLGLSQVANGTTALLYDERARNVTEATLWHGGEAFTSLSRAERKALVKFVKSI